MNVCWVCGKREAVTKLWGYPVCDECRDRDDLDPEELEEVVIETLTKGGLVPYDEIKNKRYGT